MTTRRMLVLVAVLMGMTAIAAGLASPPAPSPRGTPEAESSMPRPTGGASELVERSVRVEKPSTVALNQGDLARVTVTGDALDVVELVGLDLTAPIAPETPAVFDLLADRPGRYPLRLVQSGEEVGAVRIVPAGE